MIEQELHRFLGSHIGQVIAQDVHFLEHVFVQQQIVTSCGGCRHVNGRVNTLVGQFAVKLQFHVTGPFEFLKDDLIHFGTGINQSSG